ncbi:MAG: thioredoxin fold domain-containing protein [Alphaproteobacteria bacterium]|nr:thioredoxin fold domain-containing protein [Alphaproteobacteria bacterium]
MLLGSIAAALAAAPTAEIGWKGDVSRLVVTAPAGMEISADAPADLVLRWEGRELTVAGSGGELTGGMAVGAVRGRTLEGEVSLQLCDKASGVCTPGRFALSGTAPDAKKGRIALTVAEAGAAHAAPEFNTDARTGADAAFARAKETGELVVLDFSAVWCPPCNLLAAEVLHARDADVLLEGFQLAVVDVDHPTSWALKDRYQVGGYPTVVVVDADGNELDRVVGYPGKEEFLAFLAAADEEKRDWASEDPKALTPDEAAEGLWAQVQDDVEEGLEAWLDASADSDTAAGHLARFRLDPNPDDATWLATNAPDEALEWVPWAGPWGDTDAAKGPLREAIQRALPGADGFEAADLLYFAAQLADEADQRTLYGAGYVTLQASLSGDDFLDRAHFTFLASLRAKSGDLDGAVAFLDGLTRTHPDDPTFLLEAAGLLNDAKRYEDALARTKLGLARAWGDNQLRVALEHCEALVGLGRDDEARGTADKLLHQDKAPDAALVVRTHRYREKLAAFLE